MSIRCRSRQCERCDENCVRTGLWTECDVSGWAVRLAGKERPLWTQHGNTNEAPRTQMKHHP